MFFSPQLLQVTGQLEVTEILLFLVIMIILLVCSGLISASEVAFFGLSNTDINDLEKNKGKSGKLVAQLMKKPKKLLTTILLFNNTVNIGLVILSTLVVEDLKILGGSDWFYLILQIVVVTAVLLLFGEILPKVYATKKGVTTALFMARPIQFLSIIFSGISLVMVGLSSMLDKLFKAEKRHLSVDELSKVHEMVEGYEGNEQEQKMLDGILEFGNTDVRRVMKPRTDVRSLEIKQNFAEVVSIILDSGYSRIPVHENGFDNIKGILYIKDLLPYLSEGPDFEWQKLLRTPFFVPENKKLDDLLIEFQEKKIHFAVVVDEYGGTCGVITMEDVIEEIVGEIRDEFDDDELEYSKLDDHKYVLDAKIQLKDLYRILDIDGDEFEEHKGDSDTIAGFILELKGDFPHHKEKINFQHYEFTIEAMDKKRIKRVLLEIGEKEVPDEVE